ncbi:MAG TPA: cation-efflux pump [Gaiella sp.]|jgi:cation diffusion facilitator family transporter
MTPERRTALASVAAAAVLIGIKLVSGLASGSLAFVAEAAHSGTDLVAALLTFYAVGYAKKPADAGHLYGHLKAEHLAALAEAAFLVLVSLGVAVLAVLRLAGVISTEVDAAWWAFLAVFLVLTIDLVRTVVSYRSARRYTSAALLSNALHFGSDFVGTLAVLGGLIAARAGWPAGDSVAALFVAGLVVVAAGRLMRRNVDVLMDRAPADAVRTARRAIAALEPPVELRRLRLRQAGGRDFADVVIAVSSAAAVGQGHAAADGVEAALRAALPGIDVVVHVEPGAAEFALRERVRAAAMTVPRVREIHNLTMLELDAGTEVSLHLKLPGETSLDVAHAAAEEVERAIVAAVPEVVRVQTHIEPLAEAAPGIETLEDPAEIDRIVREETGQGPREARVLTTPDGRVVFLTLGLDSAVSLAEAHARATAVEARVRRALPDVADVIVHTEP